MEETELLKRNQTYVADDGPSSGFSLSGWKANRPRKPAAQLVLCLGQSLTYMVTRKSATQAAAAPGTIQGDQRR